MTLARGAGGTYVARVDVNDKLETRGIVHFHRASVLCALTKTPVHVYWGHIGVNETNAYHGRIFVVAAGVRLYKVAMAPTGNTAVDRRWWLGFEGSSPYSLERTLDELRDAADFVGAGEHEATLTD